MEILFGDSSSSSESRSSASYSSSSSLTFTSSKDPTSTESRKTHSDEKFHKKKQGWEEKEMEKEKGNEEEKEKEREKEKHSQESVKAKGEVERHSQKKSSSPSKIQIFWREDDELKYEILLGIRSALSPLISGKDTMPSKEGKLEEKDFDDVEKFKMPSRGTESTPAHSGVDFTFYDFSPKVFFLLRRIFGIDTAEYMASLTGDHLLSKTATLGKSGSFFYYSSDMKFVLKTLNSDESHFLRKFLPHYFQHMIANPNTLITKFYGFHQVKAKKGKKISFVVMGNIFAQPLRIHERYDLKGSSIGRTVGENKKKSNPHCVMKDLDFTRFFLLGNHKRELFLEQLQKDCRFLASQNIMDYSLLVGIHDIEKEAERGEVSERKTEEEAKSFILYSALNTKSSSPPKLSSALSSDQTLCSGEGKGHSIRVFVDELGGFRSSDENDKPSNEIYFLGIIDILQPYNYIKKMETSLKSLRYDQNSISSVEPKQYAERVLNFISKSIKPSPLKLEIEIQHTLYPEQKGDEKEGEKTKQHQVKEKEAKEGGREEKSWWRRTKIK